MTEAFACYNKNEAIRMRSSSGGFYYLTAEKIISIGGVVYGACYEGTDVKHRRIDSVEGILPSCGSKYQPSALGDTYRRIKEDLEAGKTVLFAGTPCQCEGLLSFAGENEKLYCSDCICHGIPSKKAWRAYLASMRYRGMEVKSVNMRDKVSGWLGYSWRLTGEDDKEIIEPHNQNMYMRGFLSNLYLRPSCYECKFKGIERQTDFTMGDYWGNQNIQPEMFDNKGTSLVLVHTEKGKLLFEEISAQLEYKEADLRKAIKANRSIIESACKTVNRKKFFEGLNEQTDFIKLVDGLTKISFHRLIIRKTKYMVKRALNAIGYTGPGPRRIRRKDE